MTQVIIERTLGGYIVSKLQSYCTHYCVEYSPCNVSTNLFGQRLCDIMPRDIQSKLYTQTRYKAGEALSGVFKTTAAASKWAKSNNLAICNIDLHRSI